LRSATATSQRRLPSSLKFSLSVFAVPISADDSSYASPRLVPASDLCEAPLPLGDHFSFGPRLTLRLSDAPLPLGDHIRSRLTGLMTLRSRASAVVVLLVACV